MQLVSFNLLEDMLQEVEKHKKIQELEKWNPCPLDKKQKEMMHALDKSSRFPDISLHMKQHPSPYRLEEENRERIWNYGHTRSTTWLAWKLTIPSSKSSMTCKRSQTTGGKTGRREETKAGSWPQGHCRKKTGTYVVNSSSSWRGAPEEPTCF